MKDVSAVLPPQVQVLDPVTEVPLDELQDTLVLMQVDELPQGVLELMAALILRHRPMMDAGHAVAWQSQSGGQGALEVGPDEGRSPAPMGGSYPQASPLPEKLVSPSMPQPLAAAIAVEHALVGSPANRDEPLPPEPATSSRAPAAMQLPEAPLNLQVTHQAPRVVQPPVPSAVILQPQPVPEVMHEILPGPDRGLLQVPFNNGAASGQVTISRMAEEPVRNLLLNPSNAQVFDQIKAALELTREPGWQLTDNGGEEQGRGSHQSPDEEQAEQQDVPA